MPVPRPAPVIVHAAQRSRTTAGDRLRRLVALSPAIGQTALAAAAAWLLATEGLGHRGPFVAPVSAIVALGITYGQRTRRSVEIVVGVAVGVLVADLITVALGRGAGQIALVIALAMAASIVLGGSRLVVTQAATSAVLVAAVSTSSGSPLTRPLDALTGGFVALVVNLLLFPADPRRLARRAAQPLLEGFAGTLGDVASALEQGDHDAAIDATVRAGGLAPAMERFAEAASVGGEVAAHAPLRRRDRGALARYEVAARHAGYAVVNLRVLARGAVRAIDLEDRVPPETIDALRDLSDAVGAMAPDPGDDERAQRARSSALRAAGGATLGLEKTANLSASVLVGQVRSMATDLLRALGVADEEASLAVRAAAGELAREQRG